MTLVPYGTIPKVTVHLAIDAGNVDETPQQVWLADLTGALLKEGTRTRSAEAVAESLAKMGGSLGVGVGLDVTSITTDVLSEFAAGAVGVLADVAQHPALPASELPRLKADLARTLSLQRSQPQSLANEQFARALYGDHPYGRIFPTEAMLDGFTHADVQAFHARTYGASRAHLYVVGRFDADAVRKAIRASFGSWPRGTAARRTPPTPSMTRTLHVIDRPKAPQSTLYIGLPVIDPSHPDYIALRVTNALLGGSFASRITANIREQKGYTYSPNSSLSVAPEGRALGAGGRRDHRGDRRLDEGDLLRGGAAAEGGAARGRARRHPQLHGRAVRAPELVARRHHPATGDDAAARPRRRLPGHARAEVPGRHARRRPAHRGRPTSIPRR